MRLQQFTNANSADERFVTKTFHHDRHAWRCQEAPLERTSIRGTWLKARFIAGGSVAAVSLLVVCLWAASGSWLGGASQRAIAAEPVKAAESAKDDDWPLFRGDALASGVSKSVLPAKLELLWKVPSQGTAFESTPAIVDGVVYIGDMDGRLYAFDLGTGEKKWESKFEDGFLAGIAAKDGAIYLGDIAGKFYCVDAATGKTRWGFTTQAEIDSSANFYKDRVIVGSQDATLYCLSRSDGKLVWKFSIADQIRCSPTIVENRAFVAGCDSKLHVVDLDEGKELASVEIEAPTGVTPAVRGERVYFGTEAGTFFAVNWRNATVAWTFQPDRGNQPFRSSPAVTAEAVVFGGRNKRLHALDPQTGKPLWEYTTRNRIDGSPVVVGDRVFVGAADGRLYALDLKTGKLDWQYEAGGGFNGSPGVSRGRLVIANDNGTVYCFGEKKP